MSERETRGVNWADLPPARAGALCALAESYYYTGRLQESVDALEDPRALAYVDLAISVLERLQTLLEAPGKTEDGRRKTEDGRWRRVASINTWPRTARSAGG